MAEERLDRIESLIEKLGQRVDSNARAIEALTSEWRKDRQAWQKDRKQSYQWMARLSASQANFWETQADYYRRLEDVEDRQATMLEILDRLTNNNNLHRRPPEDEDS